MLGKVNVKYLILCILCCLYLFFPTQNSSTDAWYYAASVKYGEDLFLPHHLFHSTFLYLCYKGFSFFVHIDAMAFCKIMNGLFATIVMALFARLLQVFEKKEIEIAAWTFLVGVSFGIWRYATENETYHLPLIFSLLATFFYNTKINKPNKMAALFSGFFAAFACLFHQLHIVWAFGLGIAWLFYGNKKEVFAYLIPFAIIPIAYFSVYYLTVSADFLITHFMQFVLHDFHTGSASLSFGFWNIGLTLLNFIRSFLQVHGSIFVQIKSQYLYAFPIFIGIILLFLARKFPIEKVKTKYSAIFFGYACIFALQIFFACLAMGNAEFMVMIPLLSALMLAAKWDISPKIITFVGISLFIWNFTYAILPNARASYQKLENLMTHIAAHEQDTYLLNERPMTANALYYFQKKWHYNHLQHAPAIWLSKGQNLDSLVFICDSTLQSGGHVFTDAYQKNDLLNRESVRYQGNDSLFWKKYRWIYRGENIWEGRK